MAATIEQGLPVDLGLLVLSHGGPAQQDQVILEGALEVEDSRDNADRRSGGFLDQPSLRTRDELPCTLYTPPWSLVCRR